MDVVSLALPELVAPPANSFAALRPFFERATTNARSSSLGTGDGSRDMAAARIASMSVSSSSGLGAAGTADAFAGTSELAFVSVGF